MKYYRVNKKKGVIELIDSETNEVKVATHVINEEKKLEVPEPKIDIKVVPEEEIAIDEEPIIDEKILVDEFPSVEYQQTVLDEESIVDEFPRVEYQQTSINEEPKRSKTIIITIMLALMIIGILAAIILILRPFDNNTTSEDEIKKEPEVQTKNESINIKDTWKANKAINSDYVGQLVFESGLIDQPVVQGTDNETYFRTNWKDMSNDEEGSVFMDYRNELDDQNLIIYGHYVYPEYEINTLGREKALGDRMFTPLAKLKDKANYEKNKYVNLYLENEIIRYQVAVVFHCILDAEQDYVAPIENMYYCITNYDEEYFETYKKTIYENALYDTGVEINYNDKLLTLQTCVEGHDELLEIVVCKQISRTTY